MSKKAVVMGPKRGAGKSRELIRRRWVTGMPMSQIAREVGISRQAVYRHVHVLEAEKAAKEAQRANGAKVKRFGKGGSE